MKSWHVRKMQRRNQKRESRRKLSEEAFLWKDFLFRTLRFLQKKAIWLFVCRREMCIHTCVHTQTFHTRRDSCTSVTPSWVQQCAPTDFTSLFLTGRLVLLPAAGWHEKGTNPKKSLHPAPTHKPMSLTYALTFPTTRACPGYPQELQWN